MRRFTVTFGIFVLVVSSNLFSQNVYIQDKRIFQENDCFKIEISYPSIESSKFIFLNREITSNINSVISQVRSESICEELKQFNEDFKAEGFVSYSVCFENNRLISFYIDYYTFLGGAHGMSVKKGYSLDKKLGKVLKLNDLFAENYDYKTVINDFIYKEIETKKALFFDEDFKGINPDTEFYIEDNCIVIYFQLYEIAPYSTGFPTFKIPLEKFGNGYSYKIEEK